jgi:hypothetical protein
MQFETFVPTAPGVFYSLKLRGKSGYYFLPTRSLPKSKELHVMDFRLAKNISCQFTIGLVGEGGYVEDLNSAAGVLFYTPLPAVNYGTGILAYSRAWHSSLENVLVSKEDTILLLKTSEFYVYKATDMVTAVTCSDLSEDIDSYLTMI